MTKVFRGERAPLFKHSSFELFLADNNLTKAAWFGTRLVYSKLPKNRYAILRWMIGDDRLVVDEHEFARIRRVTDKHLVATGDTDENGLVVNIPYKTLIKYPNAFNLNLETVK